MARRVKKPPDRPLAHELPESTILDKPLALRNTQVHHHFGENTSLYGEQRPKNKQYN